MRHGISIGDRYAVQTTEIATRTPMKWTGPTGLGRSANTLFYHKSELCFCLTIFFGGQTSRLRVDWWSFRFYEMENSSFNLLRRLTRFCNFRKISSNSFALTGTVVMFTDFRMHEEYKRVVSSISLLCLKLTEMSMQLHALFPYLRWIEQYP